MSTTQSSELVNRAVVLSPFERTSVVRRLEQIDSVLKNPLLTVSQRASLLKEERILLRKIVASDQAEGRQ
jgi:hypothetical protein